MDDGLPDDIATQEAFDALHDYDWHKPYEQEQPLAAHIDVGARRKGMSPLRERFCQEYIVDLNTTRAARRAGYSRSTAETASHNLLKVPQIVDRIAELQEARARRTQKMADDVVRALALAVHVDPTKDIIISDAGKVSIRNGAPRDIGKTVTRVSRRVSSREFPDGSSSIEHYTDLKLSDKNASAGLLLRHLGKLPENIRLTDGEGKPLPIMPTTVSLVIREEPE